MKRTLRGSFRNKHWRVFGYASLLPILFCALAVRNALLNRDELALKIFRSFWASGFAAAHHLDPYAVYPLTLRFYAFRTYGPRIVDLNLNPPVMLPFFSAWTVLSPTSGAAIWCVSFTLLFLLVAAGLMWRYSLDRKQIWWLLTSGATLGSIIILQDYSLLLLLSALAWTFLSDEADLPAGVCLGVLIAIKPNFLLWPLFLALNGSRKPLLPAALTAGFLSMVPVLLYGPGIYLNWLHAAAGDPHWIVFLDSSLTGVFSRAGLRSSGIVLSGLLLAMLAILAWRGPRNRRNVSGMAICAAILCSPIGWMHYVLVLAPLLMTQPWVPLETAAMILFWILPIFPLSQTAPPWQLDLAGLIYFAGFLLLTASFSGASIRSLGQRPAATGTQTRVRAETV